jgi:hypothetical protein
VKSRDLIEALVASLGVYEVVQGLNALGYLVPLGEAADLESSRYVSAVAYCAVPILLGACLLLGRARIADHLALPGSDSDPGSDSGGFLESLLAVAGVCIAISAIAAGAAVATGDYLRADLLRQLSGEPPRADEIWPPRVRVLVQFVLGVGLALGRSGLAEALRSLRRGGRSGTAV